MIFYRSTLKSEINARCATHNILFKNPHQCLTQKSLIMFSKKRLIPCGKFSTKQKNHDNTLKERILTGILKNYFVQADYFFYPFFSTFPGNPLNKVFKKMKIATFF
jgi:hypothetical protein